MHDIDNTRLESSPEYQYEQYEDPSQMEMDSGEAFEEGEDETLLTGGEGEGVLMEDEEEALAAELLGVSSEEEMDQFLGGLFRRLSRSIGGAARFLGRNAGPLGGALKGIAGKALPFLGGALGTAIPIPGVGTAIGTALGSAAGRLLQSETEDLEEGEQDFEMAKRFVRLASRAVRYGARRPLSRNPSAAAHLALRSAIRTWRRPVTYRGYNRRPFYRGYTGYQQPLYRNRPYANRPYGYRPYGYRSYRRWPYYGVWPSLQAPQPWPLYAEPPSEPMGMPVDDGDMNMDSPGSGGTPAQPPAEPPASAPAQPSAAATPGAESESDFESGFAGESQDEGDGEFYESNYETFPDSGYDGGRSGRWVRRGRKIVLYGL